MILRGVSYMGAPASSRRGPVRLVQRGAHRLGPAMRPDPNLGGLWSSVTGAVSGAVHSAIDTTVSSISIPLQTVSAVAQGNFGQVPGLLSQAVGTLPLVSHLLPGGSGPAPAEATAATTATLQAQAAAATQGLTPGTPQYAAALQAAGLVPAAPASNLPLYLGGAGVLLAAVLLLRRRAPQS